MDIVAIVIFLLIPLLSIVFCFVKDYKTTRNSVLNIILITNCVIYLLPILLAYFSTPKGGNMWDENGAGAYLWFYMILIPICFLVMLILGILKFIFRNNSKKLLTDE